VVAIAIASSIVAVFFYVRFVLLMFFAEPAEGQPVGEVVVPSWGSIAVIGVCAAATIFFGVVPDPVLHLIANAGSFLG
jgi:NADH-quinone oxidoreductase subunit N